MLSSTGSIASTVSRTAAARLIAWKAVSVSALIGAQLAGGAEHLSMDGRDYPRCRPHRTQRARPRLWRPQLRSGVCLRIAVTARPRKDLSYSAAMPLPMRTTAKTRNSTAMTVALFWPSHAFQLSRMGCALAPRASITASGAATPRMAMTT